MLGACEDKDCCFVVQEILQTQRAMTARPLANEERIRLL
jgi:hypothetical protein